MNRIKKYFRVIRINFRNGTVYKLDYIAGIINIIFVIIINIILWKTLYQNQNLENSIQYKMMITYIILSTIFQTVFIMDEFSIESKMRDGSIIHYLIKPMSFRMYTFACTLGRSIFNFIMLLIPSVIIVKIFFDILLPYSLTYSVYFIITAGLGYLVLYNFSFIFWTFSLEYMTSWGIIMFKNALVVILSGALVPLWLMPDKFAEVAQYLPFQSVYYFPLSTYLGIISEGEILQGIVLQFIWILAFVVIGDLAWRRAVKKVAVQGG